MIITAFESTLPHTRAGPSSTEQDIAVFQIPFPQGDRVSEKNFFSLIF